MRDPSKNHLPGFAFLITPQHRTALRGQCCKHLIQVLCMVPVRQMSEPYALLARIIIQGGEKRKDSSKKGTVGDSGKRDEQCAALPL